MTITAKIIADSIGEHSPRLTTFQLRYPRFIHAELMTHRAFSRNASSSRAIPVERLIEDVIRDTAMPLHWGKNQPGMQAREEHDARVSLPEWQHIKDDEWICRNVDLTKGDAWTYARDAAIETARAFAVAGYHKQIVNRLLEPFAHINVLVTSTNYSNFFALRDHPDAQPEIMVLAQAMKAAMDASTPERLLPGQWHLPYVDQMNEGDALCDHLGFHGMGPAECDVVQQALIKLSVARCARVSYLTHEGKEPVIEKDLQLYEDLVGSVPLHASPAEHQATPDECHHMVTHFSSNTDPIIELVDGRVRGVRCDTVTSLLREIAGFKRPYLGGNLGPGWIQYRKTLPGECQ